MYKIKLIGNIIEPGNIHSIRTSNIPGNIPDQIECVYEKTDFSKVLGSLEDTDIYLFSEFNSQYYPILIEIVKKSKHCIFFSPHCFSLEQINQLNQLCFESGSNILFYQDAIFHPLLSQPGYESLLIKHIEVKDIKTGKVTINWESLQKEIFQALYLIFWKNKSKLKHIDVIQHALLTQSADFISIGMQFDDNNTATIQYGTGVLKQKEINIYAENKILHINMTNYSVETFTTDENKDINTHVKYSRQQNVELSVANMIDYFLHLVHNKNKCNSLENIIQVHKCMHKIIEKLRIN